VQPRIPPPWRSTGPTCTWNRWAETKSPTSTTILRQLTQSPSGCLLNQTPTELFFFALKYWLHFRWNQAVRTLHIKNTCHNRQHPTWNQMRCN
jgi:hypothetical protein